MHILRRTAVHSSISALLLKTVHALLSQCKLYIAGTQLAVLIQALSRQLALVLLIAMTCGLQAMALVMPPPADSIEVASIVWYVVSSCSLYLTAKAGFVMCSRLLVWISVLSHA